jgi:histidinol dehydrogenase
MPVRLDRSSADFDQRFGTFLAAKREVSADVERATRAIVDDVAARGDTALIEATRKFDRLDIEASGLRVTAAEIEAAVRACDSATLDALKFARDRIEAFHRRQLPKDVHRCAGCRARLALERDRCGRPLCARWHGGLSVLGADECRAGPSGRRATRGDGGAVARRQAQSAGAGGGASWRRLRNLRVGGAQAVAALAYGTATIAPVAKIVGPGNAFVAAAKRQVFGKVGIDMIAGPSEVLVIADDTGNAGWIAADLLAQAEHDASAQSILITDSAPLAAEVERAVESQLATLPRAEIARASWNDFGAIIMVKTLDEAVVLANAIAAEHLEIMTADAEGLSQKVRNAGAIFLGSHTPEAIGDYVGGSNHVLPTARSARFSSGLGVLDFMKRTSILKCGPDQLRALGPAAMTLGMAEGLDAHSRSVGLRLNLP